MSSMKTWLSKLTTVVLVTSLISLVVSLLFYTYTSQMTFMTDSESISKSFAFWIKKCTV